MFSHVALSASGQAPSFLLAAAETSPGVVSAGFILVLLAIAAVSLVIEYLYARFGESMAANGRFAVTAVVMLLMHVFWRTWAKQTNIVAESLAPDASGFRLTIWLFLILSTVLPAWLIYSAAMFTWRDRFIPGGLPLVLTRAAVCVGLVVALAWLGADCAELLAGVRLAP